MPRDPEIVQINRRGRRLRAVAAPSCPSPTVARHCWCSSPPLGHSLALTLTPKLTHSPTLNPSLAHTLILTYYSRTHQVICIKGHMLRPENSWLPEHASARPFEPAPFRTHSEAHVAWRHSTSVHQGYMYQSTRAANAPALRNHRPTPDPLPPSTRPSTRAPTAHRFHTRSALFNTFYQVWGDNPKFQGAVGGHAWHAKRTLLAQVRGLGRGGGCNPDASVW